MTPRVILIIVAGLLAGAAAGLTVVTRQAPSVATKYTTTGQALIGGPFSLTTMTGEAVTDQTYLGRPMLVYFGFTHCPDICPAGLQIITAALDQLGDKASGLTPLFITLDPERDTQETLAAYMKSFHPRLIGLTGTPEETARAAKAYRVYAKKVPNENAPKDYSVDHSGFMYVMDASGKYVTHFPHNTSADKLSAALTAALAKS
jgi:protein SCO1